MEYYNDYDSNYIGLIKAVIIIFEIMRYINFWLKLCEIWTNYPLVLVQLKCKMQLTDEDVTGS